MTERHKGIARLSATVLGSLLIGLPAGAARAAEPTTASEARAQARLSAERATQYSEMGGVAYKTGLVQREQLDAARYNALAEQLSAPVAAAQPSPEAAHYAALAAHYRFVGGAAYKAGLVQSAEAQARAAEAAAEPAAVVAPTTVPEPPSPICMADKPVAQMACEAEVSNGSS